MKQDAYSAIRDRIRAKRSSGAQTKAKDSDALPKISKARMARVKRKRSTLTEQFQNAPKKQQALAEQLAALYRRKYHSRRLHAQLWEPNTPFAELPVSIHFLKAARIILNSIKTGSPIDPKNWVFAQFEAWNGPKSRMPLPTQLHSQGAFDRYNDWLNDRATTESVLYKADKLPPSRRFEAAQRKLEGFMEVYGWDEKKALRHMHSEFSSDFIRHKDAKLWAKLQHKENDDE